MTSRLVLLCCLALLVAAPTARAQGILGALRDRARDPSGFSIEAGVGFGAEVDDIEAEIDFGPFGFTLDPMSVPEEKEEDEDAGEVCEEYCDQQFGTTCCMDAAGVCVPNGGSCPVAYPQYHDPYYGRKLLTQAR